MKTYSKSLLLSQISLLFLVLTSLSLAGDVQYLERYAPETVDSIEGDSSAADEHSTVKWDLNPDTNKDLVKYVAPNEDEGDRK
jgi:hypothetical protein